MGENFSRYLLRFVVAAYLIYLGVSLIRDVVSGSEPTNMPALFIVFAVAFLIIAAVLIVTCFMSLVKKGNTREKPEEVTGEISQESIEESNEETSEEIEAEEIDGAVEGIEDTKDEEADSISEASEED